MRKIEADRDIVLKPLQKTSAAILYRAIEENRKYLRDWLPFIDATTEEKDTLNYINSVIGTDCPKKDEVYEIWYQDVFAGLVGLKEIDHINRKAEMGYWLVEKMQGKGIMIKSCRALLNYAFGELGLNRMQIKTALGNDKSMQIPFRLHFVFEGIERQGEKLYEKFTDLKVFSMLKKEWKSINKEINGQFTSNQSISGT